MQKNSNIKKGIIFQNSNVRTEMLYKNMDKYNMVDNVLSPAIGTAYYTHQSDNIKLSQIKGGLVKKTHGDENVNDVLYNVSNLSKNSNEYYQKEDYIKYIDEIIGINKWHEKASMLIRKEGVDTDAFIDIFRSATLFEDAPGVIRYVQPIVATTGTITTNLNNFRNVDTKLGTLSNLFYGTSLRNAAYLNELRRIKTITPSLKNEYGNNVSNLYNLPYLLPIDDETGRVSGFDNGYYGKFINEYDEKSSSEYLTQIYDDYLIVVDDRFKRTNKNPYGNEDDFNTEPTYGLTITDEQPSNDKNIGIDSKFYNKIDNIIDTKGKIIEHDNLLYKTKELFKRNKIGSILYEKQDKDGISKGSGVNCRVWTPSKPYSKISHLIRGGVNFAGIGKLQRLKGFIPDDNVNYLINNTSLNYGTGLVNIVPSSKWSTIDIKKCMFSIENLAWKDVKKENNDNFPKYEQGPNGGRIMWFPPYNLKFTENIGVNWNSHSFIGRGEQMYTYTNTDRSGTLGFTILIDNPSIIEAYKNRNLNKENYVNFFAGCDIVTDTGVTIKRNADLYEYMPSENTKPKVTSDDEYNFSIYFPNNYSGIDSITDSSFPFHYLVYGNNANCGQYSTLEGLNNTRGYEMLAEGVTTENNHENDSETSYNNYYYNVDEAYIKQTLKKGNYRDINTFKFNSKGNGDTDFNFVDVYVCLEKLKNPQNDEQEIINAFVEKRGAVKEYIEFFRGNILNNRENIEKIIVKGCASSHGDATLNNDLANNRAKMVKEWLNNGLDINDEEKFELGTIEGEKLVNISINDKISKFYRRVDVTIIMKNGEVTGTSIDNRTKPNTIDNKNTKEYKENEVVEKINEYNEADFFDYIASDGSFIQQYTEKVKYFSPAFHSISPEGFNSRLNFIHQCTRQGGTYESTEKGVITGNLAFGRAPVCILRIGDFYNTRIIIESVTIDYDNNQWDLNPEGIGVQPMVANVNMTFKFIGGSSLGGAINRLQNALSFNYYANTSAFEKRSDMSNVDNNDDTVITRRIELEDKRNFPRETKVIDNK